MSWEAWSDPPEPIECKICEGLGTVEDHEVIDGLLIVNEQPCTHCNGTGEEPPAERLEDDVI